MGTTNGFVRDCKTVREGKRGASTPSLLVRRGLVNLAGWPIPAAKAAKKEENESTKHLGEVEVDQLRV